MSFKSTRKSRRHRIPRQENSPEKEAFFQPLEPKNPVVVQPKLTVGAPDDKYEREADNVADRVVSKNATGEAPAIQSKADSRMERDREIQEKPDKGARTQVQRMVESEEEPVQAKSAEEEEPLQAMSEEEEPVQAMEEEEEAVQPMAEEEEPVQAMEEEEEVVQPMAEEEEPVQAMEEEEEAVQPMTEEEEPVQAAEEEEEPVQAKAKATATTRSDLAGRLRSRAGKGRQLAGPAKEKMESGFGRDFSGVNVHTDAAADEMNRELGARAFARGQDVYFKSGEYNPDTAAGQLLLAHELTHTVQQGGGGVQPVGKDGNTAINQRQALPAVQAQAVVFPWEGVVDTRWNAALRSSASAGPGNSVARLQRNTRVTVTGITNNWLAVRTTINGSVVNGFVHQRLVSAISANANVAANADSRREVTDFGNYNVYPNAHTGLDAGTNELYEAEFQRLKTAWDRVGDNTGGLLINGLAADTSAVRTTIGQEMARSQTFRNLLIEITEDAGHPVTINAGRDNAFFADNFATNNVDVRDHEYADDGPRPNYEWSTSRGEIFAHWLGERRHGEINGTGFAPAHTQALAAGGIQDQYRADVGAPGRIQSQTGVQVAPGLLNAVFTHSDGNVQTFLMDNSGGDPVPYEVRYAPVAPTAANPVSSRINRVVTQLTSTSGSNEVLYLKFTSNAGTRRTLNIAGAGNPLNDRRPLGQLVPAGATITVEVHRFNFSTGNDLIMTLNWNHPFTGQAQDVVFGGVTYRLTTSLSMDP